MEAVAQRNQSQSDNVVANQLLEVLTGLLQLQQKHNGLLRPVTRLQQVIRLEDTLVLAVGESLEHGSRVEVPNIRPAHNVQSKRSEDTKVDRGVDLLHEAGSLTLTPDSAPNSQRANQLLHDELAREREDDGVKGHEGDILLAFAVHDRSTGGLGGLRIGEEDCTVHRVGGSRVDRVQRQQEEHDDQREQPCIPEAGIGESMKEGAIATLLRRRLPGGLVRDAILQLLSAKRGC